MNTDITKLIYSNTDSDEITELQSLLYSDEFSFDDYLNKALAKLNALIKDHFGNEYCFGKLYYLGSLVPFDFHKIDFYNNPDNQENQIFHNGIRTAESLVDERRAESLSVVLIKGKLRGMVLHKGIEKPIPIPGITSHNHQDDSYSTFSTLENDILQKIQPILSIHKDMAEQCSGEVYSYLLRTRNFDEEYNGSLYLVFKRRKDEQGNFINGITVDEYSRIVDFFNHIMHAKSRYDNKNNQWKIIIEQITHSKYNQRAVVNDNAETLLNELKKRGLGEIYDLYEKNETLRKNLDRIDDFFFALNKIGHKKINLSSASRMIQEILTPQKINLGELITQQIEILQKSLRVIPFAEENQDKIIESYLTTFSNTLNGRFNNLKLKTVAEGFSVVVLDLLKNAVRYTDDKNPELKIELYPFKREEIDPWLLKDPKFLIGSTEYLSLAFSNNAPIVFPDADSSEGELYLNDYNNILGKSVAENTSNTSQLGVRIIRTITNYDGLGESGLRWYYTPSTECLDGIKTKILLLIPKSDFIYGL